jgi:hypothetical protein
MTETTLITIGAGVLAVLCVAAIVQRLQERTHDKPALIASTGEAIKKTVANFFGQESKGVWQIRGIGTLILTKKELYFRMLLPQREWRIPLSTILRIETTKTHLKKTQGDPLLKVSYHNEHGNIDSIAWRVADMNGWTQAIEAQRAA